MGILAVALTGFFVMFFIRPRGRSEFARFLPFFICLLCVVGGGLRMKAELLTMKRIQELQLDGEAAVVLGNLHSLNYEDNRIVLVLEDCWVERSGETGIFADSTGRSLEYPLRRVQVYLEQQLGEMDSESYRPLKLGNQIQVRGTLQSFSEARNLGGFDSRRYYQALRIDYRMKGTSVYVLDVRYDQYRERLRQCSAWAGQMLTQITEGVDTGIYRAALLGDKTELDGEIRDLYQRSGIAHLLAISGLHLSLIGMAAHRIFRRVGLGYGGAGISGGILVISYAILTGASPSVIRASVMLSCGFLAAYLGRTYDLLSALGLSGFLILWESPMFALQAGFQLSFGAILGIGWLLPRVERLCYLPTSGASRLQKIGYLVQKGLLASVCVQLATTPILLYHYFQIPLYGICLNLLVIPLMGYVVASGIAGILVGACYLPAGRFVTSIGHYILGFYEALCRLVETFPKSNLVFGQPAIWQVVGYYTVIVGISIGMVRNCEKISHRKRMLAAVGMMLAVLILLPIPARGLQVTFLDVGQGDGICLRMNGMTILVDGGSSDEKNLGKYTLEPYLKSQGTTVIDYAFVSHGDADHMNGLLYLLTESKDITVHNLMLPILGKGDQAYDKLREAALYSGSEIYWIGAGDTLQMGELTIACLFPAADDSFADRNEQSMVLRVGYGLFQLILTGDMSGAGEQILLQRMGKQMGDISVLKLAHHGSRFSNSALWMELVQPMWAVISYGRENSYGHPHTEVLERLEEYGIECYGTADRGAVSLHTDGTRIRWSTFQQ